MRLLPLVLFLVLASCATTQPPPQPYVQLSEAVPTAVGLISLQPGEVDAFTFGRTIFVRPGRDADSAFMRHELKHSEQWDRWGVLLPILYLGDSLLCWCRQNRFEREADGLSP